MVGLKYIFDRFTRSYHMVASNTCLGVHICTLSLLTAVLLDNSIAQPLASDKTKFVGNIVNRTNTIPSDFLKYWNQLTPGHACKWGEVEASPGNYSWTAVDLIYDFAARNKLPFKYHTLIWGKQYPSFVATLDSAALYARIEAWIKMCGERCPKSAMVDVVNEPLRSFTGVAANLSKALGGSGKTGWDWVIQAFELTRKYWPSSARLILNDVNIINSTSATENLIAIINILKSRGLIDGIGVQAHNFEIDGPAVSLLSFNLKKLTATGIPVYITEFDISSPDDNVQLEKYRRIFPTLYEEPGVVGITLWGYVYNQTWIVDAHLLDENNEERLALVWLKKYLQAPFRPIPISPKGTIDEPINPRLVWQSSETATSYHLQIFDNYSLTSFVVDTTIADTTFQGALLQAGTVYYWRVSAKNDKAEGECTDVVCFMTGDKVAFVTNEGVVPLENHLYQNYPNPFNGRTIIQYHIAHAGHVSLSVYDVLGIEVAVLVSKALAPGTYSAVFNATNEISSGVYFCTLRTDNWSSTRKIVIL